MNSNDLLRALPSVDELAARFDGRYPRTLVVAECRSTLENLRKQLLAGAAGTVDAESLVADALAALSRPSLRKVINATGVILHTNLGRAPLAGSDPVDGYCNLEYDLAAGRRGKRDAHTSTLLERLLGVPAIAVNNGAAAVFLALHELAAGGEVLVSRGELIEIGDGFRIPDIMSRSGAKLIEVGTTNRTRLDDYRVAISERTRAILRVHPSNFQIQGFTGKPELRELVALGQESGLPVYEDLGSGCLLDLAEYGVNEPTIAASLAEGVDLVSFSGDKLLGGAQAGILAGKAEIVARLRKNPLFRALRLDKLVIGALETTLRHLLLERYDEIPALRMIRLTAEEIRLRAQALAARLPGAEVIAGESVVGGGSTPGQTLPTMLVALSGDPVSLESCLRTHDPAVVARIQDGRVVLDLRTVPPEDETNLVDAVRMSRSAGQCGAL